jgi:hypothetical protein
MRLRNRIWETYRPGQEVTMTPSREYLDAARAVQQWIAENYPPGSGDDEPKLF